MTNYEDDLILIKGKFIFDFQIPPFISETVIGAIGTYRLQKMKDLKNLGKTPKTDQF